ncbi:apelin receptor early endogenous ligand [Synchiropus splendidus]|uniref:apelin receptor early endogenous ligand n=1 Tax=Synchiropus splendidus TaxID=270530 RepID=UPI00237E2C26|nr:apelin receptor early endogenous ligand [Synchiropus splendidus]
MRIFNLMYLLLLLLAAVTSISSARPGTPPDFLNLRRKYHRHHCPHRRCLPLHSRVPFP